MMSFWIIACSTYDERYYLTHLSALQQELAQCPDQAPKGMSCVQLEKTAAQINNFSYKLRTNPQQFGKEILVLQEAIEKQENRLKTHGEHAELEKALNANKRELNTRMAVVRWLGSPGG